MMFLKLMQHFIVDGPLEVTEAGIKCQKYGGNCAGCFFHAWFEDAQKYGCGAKAREEEFFKIFPEYRI